MGKGYQKTLLYLPQSIVLWINPPSTCYNISKTQMCREEHLDSCKIPHL